MTLKVIFGGGNTVSTRPMSEMLGVETPAFDVSEFNESLYFREIYPQIYRPLHAKIEIRRRELAEKAKLITSGRDAEKLAALKKRIANLEKYCSPRKTLSKRRGRKPELCIKARAALEEKLADKTWTWSMLAKKYGFKGKREIDGVRLIQRHVLFLRKVLKVERITLPKPSEDRRLSPSLDNFI